MSKELNFYEPLPSNVDSIIYPKAPLSFDTVVVLAQPYYLQDIFTNLQQQYITSASLKRQDKANRKECGIPDSLAFLDAFVSLYVIANHAYVVRTESTARQSATGT